MTLRDFIARIREPSGVDGTKKVGGCGGIESGDQ